MFEKEYRRIIEQLKRNEDYIVMRAICENIIDILKENGVKVDGIIIKNVERTKTLTVVNDFEVRFNGLDFTEHDKKYADEITELKKQISELESELAVKDNLLTIKSAITCDLEDGVRIKCECPECGETFNAKLPCGYKLKEDLPFSGEDYLESLVDDLEKRYAMDQEKICDLKTALGEMANLFAEQRRAEEIRWSRE